MSEDPPKKSSVLYANATIITVNASRDIYLQGALLVEGSHIKDLGKTADLLPQALSSGVKIIHCRNKIIIPGLINTHAHLAQSLLRGLAEDLPLHSWLCDAIWPLEANYAEDDGYVAAKLTIAEMLKTGTTCFLEAMLTHRSGLENVIKAVEETRIRACLGKLIKSAESNPDLKMRDARDKDVSSMSLQSALDAHERYNGSCNGLVNMWLAAGTPRGSPIAAHSLIGQAAHEFGIGVTMHCAEAPKDLSIFRNYYDSSPFEFCRETKLAGCRSVFAHCVHPDIAAGDLEILRDTGSTVSHNPTSNLKLGSGIAPIPDMLAAGVNVSLGTDGAPCNNGYSMLAEMHLASILHSGAREEAGVVTAYDALQMATINGARALGLDHEIGSLEVGKRADFVILHPKDLASAPWDDSQIGGGGLDPVTLVVHNPNVPIDQVVVDGETLVRGGALVHLNEASIIEEAKKSIKGIRERSGMSARKHMALNYR